MRSDIHATIKKLLRRAAAGDDAEALEAGKHARTLMDRYGIEIKIDLVRARVSGGSDNYWRERLLVSIARRCGCRVERLRDGSANLVGERDSVERAREMHARAFAHVVVGARSTCPYWCDSEASQRLWLRSFGIAAADEASRLCVGKEMKREEPPPPVSAAAAEAAMASEVASLKSEMEDVPDAHSIIARARDIGPSVMWEFEWELRPRLMLPAPRIEDAQERLQRLADEAAHEPPIYAAAGGVIPRKKSWFKRLIQKVGIGGGRSA